VGHRCGGGFFKHNGFFCVPAITIDSPATKVRAVRMRSRKVLAVTTISLPDDGTPEIRMKPQYRLREFAVAKRRPGRGSGSYEEEFAGDVGTRR
jgi:hypothetical protein